MLYTKFPIKELNYCLSCCQRLVTIKDAILRQLHDDDLTVVHAALSIDGLSELISSSDLLAAMDDILKRCVNILISSKYNFCMCYVFDCLLVYQCLSYLLILAGVKFSVNICVCICLA